MTDESRNLSSDEARFAAAASEDDNHASDWLVCRCGAQWHALALADVAEIMRPLPIEPIAGAPDYVLGASIIRGGAVPVVDAGLLLGNGRTAPNRLVSLKAGARKVVLVAEAVAGIRRLAAGELNGLPPLLREVARDAVTAIGILDSALLLVLRTARLVPDAVYRDLVARKAES